LLRLPLTAPWYSTSESRRRLRWRELSFSQLGCGASEPISKEDGALVWSMESFREELFLLLDHLGIKQCEAQSGSFVANMAGILYGWVTRQDAQSSTY